MQGVVYAFEKVIKWKSFENKTNLNGFLYGVHVVSVCFDSFIIIELVFSMESTTYRKLLPIITNHLHRKWTIIFEFH